jgi:dienelactone hydrolase
VPKWFELGKYDIQFDEFEFKRQIGTNDLNKVDYTTQMVDIHRPKGPQKSSFVILFPGFTDKGSKDPRLVNFAEALAAAGIGVVIPQSFTIRNSVFTTNDIDRIKHTFTFLQGETYVAKERIGIIGFSVAGSYVLRAASSLGNRPLFLLTVGAYYSLSDLIVSIVTEKAVYDGHERSWKPNPFPKKLLRDYLDNQLGIAKTDEIFSNNGITFEELSRNNKKFTEKLDELSPYPILSEIKTTVFLMHDKNDGNTPVEDARKIRDALPENIPVYYTELSIMNHVTPNTFLSFDFIKLFWHVLSIVRLLI